MFFRALNIACSKYIWLFQTNSVDLLQNSKPNVNAVKMNPKTRKQTSTGPGAYLTSDDQAESNDNLDSLANLLAWELSQMEVFAVTLSRQLQLGVAEQVMFLIFYFIFCTHFF